ncbi:MAG TPA: choice-of-anchor tandem repeat GloVer-containing protein [Rhizomicrobium sp.]|nr:choice-of-anchor tandem repeat GloVer-containing protein [Rhizomicrobium sp.]
MKTLPLLAAFALLAGPALAEPQFSTIYTFGRPKDNPSIYPEAGLTPAPDGSLYGTTVSDGKTKHAYGTVFKLSPPGTPGTDWTLQTIYTFRGGAEAGEPVAKLIFDQDTGALLGTASAQEGGGDLGSVFRLAPPAVDGDPWSLQIIHTFTGGDDGVYPRPGLVQDPATGAVYGATTRASGFPVTLYGFAPDASHQNWTRNLGFVFPDAAGGASPSSDLVLSGDGVLYGTTENGGVANDGLIYSYDLTSNTFAMLFQSSGAPQPTLFSVGTPLIEGSALIATSSRGAEENCKSDFDCGTIFTIPLDGSAAPTVIAAPTGAKSGNIEAGVVWNPAHTALYGTTNFGLPNRCHYYLGKEGCGAVFELKQKKGGWKLSIVHAFDGTDGSQPNQLVFGADGALYGTTETGGANHTGTIFRIQP